MGPAVKHWQATKELREWLGGRSGLLGGLKLSKPKGFLMVIMGSSSSLTWF